MRAILLITLLFLKTVNLLSQTIDNFNDGDIDKNPTWVGDVDKFKVNDNLVLQLNDSDKSEASIFTENKINDDTEWFIDINLDFAPSSSNFGRIFLALQEPASNANGYYIKLGASGSNDAIELHKITNGKDEKIGEGISGLIANKPNFTLKATYVDGIIEIFADYGITGIFPAFPEISVEIGDMNYNYFGIGAKYTKSNANKFFFDNLVVQDFTPDTEGPLLKEVVVISSKSIVLVFNEAVSDVEPSNFKLKNSEINITETIVQPNTPNEVLLKFNQELSAKGSSYIQVNQIQDTKGNISTDLEKEFLFLRAPEVGSVIINEILTDPVGNGKDFIELFNNADYNVTLEGCTIYNKLNDKKTVIGDISLKANSYIALTEDVDNLIAQYLTPNEANIITQDLPSMNNSEANITINNLLGDTLDNFNYNENWHLDAINDTEGVSLERISPNNPTQDKSNWSSGVSSTEYATPGYKNSAHINTLEDSNVFSLITKAFSPNQDGLDDNMALQYSLDKPGYISTIKIYDANGYHIKTLHNNELLATKGIITWNGQDKTGRIANMGIYILIGKLYHHDGHVKSFKIAVSLLDNIN